MCLAIKDPIGEGVSESIQPEWPETAETQASNTHIHATVPVSINPLILPHMPTISDSIDSEAGHHMAAQEVALVTDPQ